MIDFEPDANDCRIFGYGRASTKQQINSPKVQEAQAKQAACDDGTEEKSKIADRLQHGDIPGTFVGFFCDTVSTRKMPFLDRPQFKLMWPQIRTGDRLIITALDRVARSLLETSRFLDIIARKDVRLQVLRHGSQELDFSSAMGRAMAGFLAVFAQWERDMLGQRVRETIAYMKTQGLRTHGQPEIGMKRIMSKPDARGRRRVDKYIEHEGERKIIREIYLRHYVANESFQSISADLRRRGLRSGDGGVWSYKRVWTSFYWAKERIDRDEPFWVKNDEEKQA